MSYNKRVLSEIDRELRDQYRSKRYSKSLAATNSLFAVNDLFAKPSRRRIYNPNAQYFQGGGPIVKYKIDILFSNPPKYQIVDIETGKSVGVYKDKTIAEFTLERLNGGPSKNIDPGFTPKDSGRPSGRQIDPGFSPKPDNDIEYFQNGGGPINTSGPRAEEAPVDEAAMNAMMKARLAYEYERGNPAAKRMVAPVDNPYDFGDGRTGTHYMSSYDNYAIPEIQDVDGTLEMTGPRDNEAIRFDREEDARYFANENYKRVSPMFIQAELDEEEIQKYVDGGYIVEDLPKAQKGAVAKAIKNISKNAKLVKDVQPNIKKLATDIVGGKLTRTIDAANRAIKDVKLGERSLGEILPITPSQKKAADLKAALAVQKGVNFNDSWLYETDPTLGKILREDISDKILDIYEFSGPQNRLDKYFAQEFRGGGGDGFEGWGRLGLGEDVTGAGLDNTLIYSGNKAGLNLENPLVQTSNILRPQGVRNILGSSLTDPQKKSVIRNYLADDTGGVNFSSLNLSVTNPGVGKIYRYPESKITDIALHEATHTGQRLGMPNRGFGEVLAKYDSDKGYYYPNEDTNIGRFFKEVMPDKDWVGSPNELHAELMVVRKKIFDNWINLPDIKEAFKRDPNTGRTLGIPERDEKIKEWALEELRNPTNETLDGMLEMSGSSIPSLNKFFKKGVSKEKKYQALRYLPGLAAPFALPGLTDDDKPKLQKGGSILKNIGRAIKNPISAPLTAFTKNELTAGNQLYRKIGNAKGLKDLIKHKGAKAPAPFRMKSGVTVDTPFFGYGTEPNENYRGIFAVETPSQSKSKYDWSAFVGGVENYGEAPFDKIDRGLLDKVPLEDLNVYRKKWFSNNYKKLDKDNLEAGLKGAGLQPLLENTFKWGTRGFLADQLFNDGDNTGGDLLGFQKGGVLELGDEVTEDMVEELRRQGYTIEEI